MFTFNSYNPFKEISTIDITSNRFKTWAISKAHNDIKVSVNAAFNGLGLVLKTLNKVTHIAAQATDYSYNQWSLAQVIIKESPQEKDVAINGIASLIYRAGRYAFESGSLLRFQLHEGYWDGYLLMPATPQDSLGKTLELMPPTANIITQTIALPYGMDIVMGMTFKEWVLQILGEETLTAISGPLTKKTLKKALRQGGIAYSSKATKGALLALF